MSTTAVTPFRSFVQTPIFSVSLRALVSHRYSNKHNHHHHRSPHSPIKHDIVLSTISVLLHPLPLANFLSVRALGAVTPSHAPVIELQVIGVAPTAGEGVRQADGGQDQGLDGIHPEIGPSPGLIYAAVGRQCFSPSLSPSPSSPLSFSLYSTPQLRTNSLNTLWVIGARGS